MKIIAATLLVLAVSGCAPSSPAPEHNDAKPSIGMANPASAACTKQGAKIDMVSDAEGNVGGICVFPDGRQCEEWALFRDHKCVAPDKKP